MPTSRAGGGRTSARDDGEARRTRRSKGADGRNRIEWEEIRGEDRQERKQTLHDVPLIRQVTQHRLTLRQVRIKRRPRLLHKVVFPQGVVCSCVVVHGGLVVPHSSHRYRNVGRAEGVGGGMRVRGSGGGGGVRLLRGRVGIWLIWSRSAGGG